MEGIKRWAIYPGSDMAIGEIGGRWVEYKDVEAELTRLRAELAEANKERDRLLNENYALRIAVSEASARVEMLTEMVYETQPGEYSPDGWTYKQAFTAELNRRKAAEHGLEEMVELRTQLATAKQHAKVLGEAITQRNAIERNDLSNGCTESIEVKDCIVDLEQGMDQDGPYRDELRVIRSTLAVDLALKWVEENT